MGCVKLRTFWKLFAFISVLLVPDCYGITDPLDVFAINSLYVSLGSPPLQGWVPVGGDPCAENWLGVLCFNAKITAINLKDANVSGILGDSLGDFSSIIEIDFSNNHIGGVIPSNLPSTVRSLTLSSNQITGNIPKTLSSLDQLTDLSFDNNNLTGEIPDTFQQLSELINLNLSGNSFSGRLPNSMWSLTVLTTLHLQKNRLTGTLDVLQDLPLKDLNVENNLFSGPIPPKLLAIPKFRNNGNPFNTSVVPPPPASSPLPTPTDSPYSDLAPADQELPPSSARTPDSKRGNKSHSSGIIKWIVISVAIVLILLGLVFYFLIYRCCKGTQQSSKTDKAHEMSFYDNKKPETDASLPKLYSPRETGYKEPSLRPLVMHRQGHHRTSYINPMATDGYDTTDSIKKSDKDHEIKINVLSLPPTPFFPFNKVTVNPLSPISTTSSSSEIPSSANAFTIAQLQQYTDSFTEENLVGKGLVGSVYRAEIPLGRVLAVKKLDTAACNSNKDFLALVCSISKLQHPNIVELAGYCAEHEQQLLVYEYCESGSLYEVLHFDDEIHKNLSWNSRIRLALGAARALEYMHEICQPPMVHKNFKSANILLDHELAVHVSDCGLAPLLSSSSLSQLASSGYGAPELELGIYTRQSDVYSFGVVMLEILTGRKSYDSARPRGEQFLVRWAVNQLHDIDSLARMVDPILEGAFMTKSLSRFADIISLCLQPEPEFRPPMSEIVQNLLHMI